MLIIFIYGRPANLMRIRESILATILVTFGYENQFPPLNCIQTDSVSIEFYSRKLKGICNPANYSISYPIYKVFQDPGKRKFNCRFCHINNSNIFHVHIIVYFHCSIDLCKRCSRDSYYQISKYSFNRFLPATLPYPRSKVTRQLSPPIEVFYCMVINLRSTVNTPTLHLSWYRLGRKTIKDERKFKIHTLSDGTCWSWM